MEQFDTEFMRRTPEARVNLEKTISLFYAKYIPNDDGNLTLYTWNKLSANELHELRFRTNIRKAIPHTNEGNINRSELLQAQLQEDVRKYAESFRIRSAAVPDELRLILDKDIDAFYDSTINDIYSITRSGFIKGYSAKQMLDAVRYTFDKRASRLTGQVGVHYEHIAVYCTLKGYELAGNERFRFIVDEKDTTCDTCLSHKDMVYTVDELATYGAFPPLHKHCGCYLVTMDGDRADIEGVTANENERQSESAWYDPLLRIPQDAGIMWDAFMSEQIKREQVAYRGPWELMDWATYGIISGIIDGSRNRVDAVLNDPNFFNIGNWVTSGILGMLKETFSSDEPLSLEHWLNSLGTASMIYGGYKAAQRRVAVKEPVRLPDVEVQAPKGAFEGKGNVTGNVLTTNEAQLRHMFRNESGHFLHDTPANRAILESVAGSYENFLGVDKYGNTWFAEMLSDGTQAWAEVRNGIITEGGLNQVPKVFDPRTGLKTNIVP